MTKIQKKQLIPEKIYRDLSEIEKADIFKKIPGFRTVNLLQIIHFVEANTSEDIGAAPLMTEILHKAIPWGWHYMRALIQAGIVDRVGGYTVGEQSYKYKISDKYKSKPVAVPLTDAKLLRRIENTHTSKRTTKHPEQNKFIRKIKIDPEALDYIERFSDPEQYAAAKRSVVKIMNGGHDIFYTVDPTSGRYHSNLTNMPSGLRKFITIDGQHLTNVDVKNSQPYISTILLTSPAKVAPFVNDDNFAMFAETLEPLSTEDVRRFIYLVNTGGIYEYLQKEFEARGITSTRKEIKKMFLTIMFAHNEVINKGRRIFAELFPAVAERFAEIRGDVKSKSSFRNFKRFAILLQAIEAHLILGKVLPRIQDEKPGTIAVTIHDSVCTSIITSDIEFIKKIMYSELGKFIGFKPTLKIEN